MTASQTTNKRYAVVGVFQDRADAEQAVDELKRAGFHDDQIGFAMRGAEGAHTAGKAAGWN